jgi:cytoskeletal protein RodZ
MPKKTPADNTPAESATSAEETTPQGEGTTTTEATTEGETTSGDAAPPSPPPTAPAEQKPEPKPATDERVPQPGEHGWVDETPMINVTCSHTGFAPSAGVMMRKGSTPYTYAEAAALVANHCGTVSKAERAKLEAAELLKPETK